MGSAYFCLQAAAVVATLGIVPWLAGPPAPAPHLLANLAIAAGHATVACLATPRRKLLREQENLSDEACDDYWLWLLCPGLALCQEAAQVAPRRAARKAAAAATAAALAPPQLQCME